MLHPLTTMVQHLTEGGEVHAVTFFFCVLNRASMTEVSPVYLNLWHLNLSILKIIDHSKQD